MATFLSSSAVKFGPLWTRAKWEFAIVPLPIALVGLVYQSHDRSL